VVVLLEEQSNKRTEMARRKGKGGSRGGARGSNTNTSKAVSSVSGNGKVSAEAQSASEGANGRDALQTQPTTSEPKLQEQQEHLATALAQEQGAKSDPVGPGLLPGPEETLAEGSVPAIGSDSGDNANVAELLQQAEDMLDEADSSLAKVDELLNTSAASASTESEGNHPTEKNVDDEGQQSSSPVEAAVDAPEEENDTLNQVVEPTEQEVRDHAAIEEVPESVQGPEQVENLGETKPNEDSVIKHEAVDASVLDENLLDASGNADLEGSAEDGSGDVEDAQEEGDLRTTAQEEQDTMLTEEKPNGSNLQSKADEVPASETAIVEDSAEDTQRRGPSTEEELVTDAATSTKTNEIEAPTASKGEDKFAKESAVVVEQPQVPSPQEGATQEAANKTVHPPPAAAANKPAKRRGSKSVVPPVSPLDWVVVGASLAVSIGSLLMR